MALPCFLPSELTPRSFEERMGSVPLKSWRMTTFVASVDLDTHGRVHEAACLAHMDRWRFAAANSKAYGQRGPLT